MENPWKKAATLQEASEKSGLLFPLNIDFFLPAGMTEDSVYYMNGLVEARYRRGSDTLTLRKSARSLPRISGDYHIYPDIYDLRHKGVILHCRGTRERINTMEFDSFNACCSICFNPGKPGTGLPQEQAAAIVDGMLQL